MAPALLNLTSHYPILSTLARYVSTLDLFHLGLTSRALHAHILSSPAIFSSLRRSCLCDGRGLQRRLNAPLTRWKGRVSGDTEIEVRLYTVRCDEAGALPCRKCGINICEECRECPRVAPEPGYPNRRPHLNGPWQNENVMCLCDGCDARLEERLRGQFLNELCDCDVYKRWICAKCVKEERRWTGEYYEKYTAGDHKDYERFKEDYDNTKVMMDHQFELIFYCMCGAFVPQEARPRCTWCKRKHRPESEWSDEMAETQAIPFDDGSYPIVPRSYPTVTDAATPYPNLAYAGPIYQAPFKNA